MAGAALLALALGSAGSAARAEVDTAGARRVVQKALDDALSVLRDATLSDAERVRRVETIAFDHFDWETLGRLVLSRNWRRLSEDERRDFVNEFQTLLSRRYSQRLDRYRGEDVAIVETRVEPRDDVTVITEVTSGRYKGVVIAYRMRRRADAWRAIDVVIEGVSLVGSYRSQFADLLGRNSPAELITLLREKNAAPHEADEETDAAEAELAS